MSLAILAATVTLFVLPNDRPMYVIENLSPEVCAEAKFIAETGKTRAQFDAEMDAYMEAHPSQNSYVSINVGRAYCVQRTVNSSANNTNGGAANTNTNGPASTSSTFHVPTNREAQERAEAICRGAGWGMGMPGFAISQPGKLDKRCMLHQFGYGEAK